MIKNPCRYCRKRTPTCHGSCSSFKDYDNKKTEERKKKDLERIVNYYMFEKKHLHESLTRALKKF